MINSWNENEQLPEQVNNNLYKYILFSILLILKNQHFIILLK